MVVYQSLPRWLQLSRTILVVCINLSSLKSEQVLLPLWSGLKIKTQTLQHGGSVTRGTSSTSISSSAWLTTAEKLSDMVGLVHIVGVWASCGPGGTDPESTPTEDTGRPAHQQPEASLQTMNSTPLGPAEGSVPGDSAVMVGLGAGLTSPQFTANLLM